MAEHHDALGIHVFAGGFTLGVQDVFPVKKHLEVHGFGLETSQVACGVETINCAAAEWPDTEGILAFGNPRCTAFSCVTGGCNREAHGAFGKQTRDAIEFCQYAAGRFDFVIWESVQQAYSVGKPLLDQLYADLFRPRNYRLAHVFVNAASFGNPQNRRRYFFVAYRDKYKFNVQPPPMPKYKPALWDALEPFMDWDVSDMQEKFSAPHGPRTSTYLFPEERALVDKLPNGWNINSFAAYAYDQLPKKFQDCWNRRQSQLPFSLHCLLRLCMTRFSPTLFSGSLRYLHPCYPRGLTLAEFSSIMGWPPGVYPVGPNPIPQLAKGVVPAVGKWLAEQVKLSLDGHWDDDWESRYCHKTNRWVGRSTVDQEQKTINLTEWFPHHQDWLRFPDHIKTPAYPVPREWNVRGALNNAVLR